MTAFLALINFFCVAFFFSETLQITAAKKRIEILQGMRNIFHAISLPKICFLFGFLYFLLTTFELLTLYMPAIFFEYFHFGRLHIAIVFVFYGLFWSIGASYINPKLSKKYSLFKILQIGSILLCLLFVALLFSSTLLFYLIPTSLMMFLFAILWPNANALISSLSPDDVQGKVMGVSNSMASLAGISAAVMGGVLLRFGWFFIHGVGLFSICVGGAFLITYRRIYGEKRCND